MRERNTQAVEVACDSTRRASPAGALVHVQPHRRRTVRGPTFKCEEDVLGRRRRSPATQVVCDAQLLDERSRSDTYLMTHCISEEEASKLIVNGFIEPIIKQLPMEYAVEMNP
jgi:hypothetical protein